MEKIFDGPGTEGKSSVDVEAIQRMAPDSWLDLCFVPVPCLKLMKLRFPVLEYYNSARSRSEDCRLQPPAPQESYLAINRRDYVVRLHSLAKHEYEMLARLTQGDSLGQAIDLVLSSRDGESSFSPEDLGNWFNRWSRWEFFSEFKIHPEVEG